MLLLLYAAGRIEMWDLENWFIKNDINKKNHLGTLEILLPQKITNESLETLFYMRNKWLIGICFRLGI